MLQRFHVKLSTSTTMLPSLCELCLMVILDYDAERNKTYDEEGSLNECTINENIHRLRPSVVNAYFKFVHFQTFYCEQINYLSRVFPFRILCRMKFFYDNIFDQNGPYNMVSANVSLQMRCLITIVAKITSHYEENKCKKGYIKIPRRSQGNLEVLNCFWRSFCAQKVSVTFHIDNFPRIFKRDILFLLQYANDWYATRHYVTFSDSEEKFFDLRGYLHDCFINQHNDFNFHDVYTNFKPIETSTSVVNNDNDDDENF